MTIIVSLILSVLVMGGLEDVRVAANPYDMEFEDLDSSGDAEPGDGPLQTFTFELDIQDILNSFRRIGLGMTLGFGSVEWSKGGQERKSSCGGQAQGAGLKLRFADCSGFGDADNALTRALKSLFNGRSEIKIAAEYGDFFRSLGQFQTGYPQRSSTKPKSMFFGDGFGEGKLAGGGFGIGYGAADIAGEGGGNITAEGTGLGVAVGNARGSGAGPEVYLLTEFIKHRLG